MHFINLMLAITGCLFSWILSGCNQTPAVVSRAKYATELESFNDAESPFEFSFSFVCVETNARVSELEPGSKMRLSIFVGNDSHHDLFLRLRSEPFLEFEYTTIDGSTVHNPDTIGLFENWYIENVFDPRAYRFLVGRATTGIMHPYYRGGQSYRFITSDFELPFRSNISSIRAEVVIFITYMYVGTDNFQSLRLQATRDFDVKGFKSIESGGAVESGEEPVDDTTQESKPDVVAGPEGEITRD